MNKPRDSLGHTSPESIPSIPSISSAPSSVGKSWAPVGSYSAPQQLSAYPDHSPYASASPIAKPKGSQPFATAEAASSLPGGNRVAIPRIHPANSHRPKRRSVRACESCRQRKIKCDGTRPVCGQCAYHNVSCSYEPNKRTRDQTQLAFLSSRVDQYEKLLRGLESESDAPTARRIRKVLKVSLNAATASVGFFFFFFFPPEIVLTSFLLT